MKINTLLFQKFYVGLQWIELLKLEIFLEKRKKWIEIRDNIKEEIEKKHGTNQLNLSLNFMVLLHLIHLYY